MVVCVAAQYGGGYGGGYQPQYHRPEPKRFISLPVPHLRINLDKLTLPLPNLMSLFSITSHTSNHHEEDDDEDEYPRHY